LGRDYRTSLSRIMESTDTMIELGILIVLVIIAFDISAIREKINPSKKIEIHIEKEG
jgi:hypothetical protein